MTEHLRRAGQVSWAVVGVAALLAVFGLIAWTVRVIFPPLILAAAIVFILNPLVTRFQHRGIPRAAGAAIAYLSVLAVLALSAVLIVPLAGNQVDELRDEWPGIERKVDRWVDDREADSQGTFWEFQRSDLEDQFSADDVSVGDQLRRLRTIGLRVFQVLLIIVLAPILAFYLLVDVPHIRRVADSLIPERARPEVMHVAHRLNRAIGGFFRGQLLVAFIVGVMCSIGLAAIGLRFWFLVGMIAGVFNLIPLIGPWIGGIPGVVIALTTGSPFKAVLVVVIMAGAQQIDNHFITPQVMQRAVRLHPAAVMLALLAGGTLGGFFGLLMAVPVAAVLKILIGHVWRVHVLGEALSEVAGEQEHEDVEPGTGMVKELEGTDDGNREEDAPAIA